MGSLGEDPQSLLAQLNPEQKRLLEEYGRCVWEQNRKFNLCSVKTEEELLRRHFLDALAALPLLGELSGRGSGLSLLDVGAGAGFIGIVLKIARPDMEVALLESNLKKFNFLSWVTARLRLARTQAIWGEARQLRKKTDPYPVVIERALAPLPEALRLCLPLTRAGGTFIAYQGDLSASRSLEAQKALKSFPAVLDRQAAYRLPEESRDRWLLAFRKAHATP